MDLRFLRLTQSDVRPILGLEVALACLLFEQHLDL